MKVCHKRFHGKRASSLHARAADSAAAGTERTPVETKLSTKGSLVENGDLLEARSYINKVELLNRHVNQQVGKRLTKMLTESQQINKSSHSSTKTMILVAVLWETESRQRLVRDRKHLLTCLSIALYTWCWVNRAHKIH